ncbi:MAG: hypothetical protein Q9220_001815 [cf. Caloplaca sp. 1 TL-2023]
MQDEEEVSPQHQPVSSTTKIELVQIIQQWMRDYPGQGFPQLAKHDQYSFESNFATEATLSETNERIWITRLGVLNIYQGWIVEKTDGSYLLVKAQYFRSDGHVYFPWLGDDLGFSDIMVAHHKEVPRQFLSIRAYARKRGVTMYDVLHEHDISHRDLVSEKRTQLDKDYKDKSPSLSSLDFENEQAMMTRWMTARDKTPPTAPSSTTGEKRTRSGRLIKERTTIKEESDDDDNNLSAVPATPPPTKKTRRLQSPFNPASKSPAAASSSPITLPLTPSSSRRSTSTVATPLSFQNYNSDGTLKLRTSHSSSSIFSSSPGAPAPPLLTLRYYLSNPSLGAIPTPYPQGLPTKTKFFKDAAAAYYTSGKRGNEIVAASVKVEGAGGGWGGAIVVRKDKSGEAAWEEVGRVVGMMREQMMGKRGKKEGGKGVVGEVRCIVGGK